MPKRDVLRQELKRQGIQDFRLERGRRVNLFALLKSLGVDNPKQTLTRFVHDEIKTNKLVQEAVSNSTVDVPACISMGPWTSTRYLGFVNKTGKTLYLKNETSKGTGQITAREKNGNSVSLPITLKPDDLYEVEVTNPTGRYYLSYRVTT